MTLPFLMVFTGIIVVTIDYRKTPGQEKSILITFFNSKMQILKCELLAVRNSASYYCMSIIGKKSS